jgi:hypothetical protein
MWKKTILSGLILSSLISACQQGGGATFQWQGRVWEDTNANGLQDSGEPGIANIQVALVVEDKVQYTSFTDEDGRYEITIHWNTDPDLEQFLTEEGPMGGVALEIEVDLLDGYDFTMQGRGDGQLDSDVDAEGRWMRIVDAINNPAIEVNAGMVRAIESGINNDGGFAEPPPPDQSDAIIPGSVDVIVDTFDFSCRPTFDEYNQLSDRTPGFQGLFSFDHPQADQLLGGEMTVFVTDPDGSAGSVVMIIEVDTSSGAPIAHFSFYDPQLAPGNYTWEIPGITTATGDEVSVESGGSGEFEIPDQKINGCKL